MPTSNKQQHIRKRTRGETLWLRTPGGIVGVTVESIGARVVTLGIEAEGDVEVLHGRAAVGGSHGDSEPVLAFGGTVG